MCLGTLEEWTVHETDTWSILYPVPNIAPDTSQILVVRLGQEASLREAKRITVSPIVLCPGLLISLLSWASCCWVKIKFVLLHHLITLFVCLLWRYLGRCTCQASSPWSLLLLAVIVFLLPVRHPVLKPRLFKVQLFKHHYFLDTAAHFLMTWK